MSLKMIWHKLKKVKDNQNKNKKKKKIKLKKKYKNGIYKENNI